MRRNNGPTKLYLFTTRTGLVVWLDLGWCDSVKKQGEEMKLYVVRRYHGHLRWQDPKHSAKYIEKEFENRHDALAYRESLGLQGIVEVYTKEVDE